MSLSECDRLDDLSGYLPEQRRRTLQSSTTRVSLSRDVKIGDTCVVDGGTALRSSQCSMLCECHFPAVLFLIDCLFMN